MSNDKPLTEIRFTYLGEMITIDAVGGIYFDNKKLADEDVADALRIAIRHLQNVLTDWTEP